MEEKRMSKENNNQEISVKAIPQWLPVKCVLCKGYGSFSYGKITCNACGGLGFIKVPAKEEVQIGK